MVVFANTNSGNKRSTRAEVALMSSTIDTVRHRFNADSEPPSTVLFAQKEPMESLQPFQRRTLRPKTWTLFRLGYTLQHRCAQTPTTELACH